MIEFADEPRCPLCGQRAMHWPGCPNQSPDGDDFFEDDEPVEEVIAAFNMGLPGITRGSRDLDKRAKIVDRAGGEMMIDEPTPTYYGQQLSSVPGAPPETSSTAKTHLEPVTIRRRQPG